ncbi:MAG: hypothetical protein IJZ30_00635 [Alphaproteobacteria bacterium]|nr:hypothetical protein [Alphaproteobacteria bacterium]
MITNREDALTKIAKTPKGNKRAKLLMDDNFRALVLSSGANVTIYEGELKDASSIKDAISDIYIGLIQRKNKKGNFDGLGALGGLAERTSLEEFNKLTSSERRLLIGKKDDIILEDNIPVLIFDMNIIRKNNVMREMSEELADIGITDITINPSNMELVYMPKVKDDNYMINIWDGRGECFAITPYCHLYKDDSGLIDTIIKRANEQEHGEVAEYKKVSLFEALKAYGNKGQKHTLEDGRDAIKDYRYPHEHLASWALASKLLDNNGDRLLELAVEVQKSANHLISFERIARDTTLELSDVAKVLNISPSALEKMEKACAKTYKNKQNELILNKKYYRD